MDRPRLPLALSWWPITAALHQRWYAGRLEDYEVYAKLVREVVRPSDRVVDLGAGRGSEPFLDIRPMAREVIGVDIDPAVLENPWVHQAHVTADGRFPFLANKSVDVVCARWVIEHVAEPEVFISEVQRVLQTGGSLIALTPNAEHYMPRLARLLGRTGQRYYRRLRGLDAEDTFRTEYRMNTLATLRTLAEHAGFAGLHVWIFENQPSYLAINPATFALGTAYERTVNASPRLRRGRGSILARFIA